jgi:cysteinyl-tRNA synthetase
LGHLFDFGREVNRAFDEGAELEASRAAHHLWRLGQILGLFWQAPVVAEWPAEVLELVGVREAARKSRDWARADQVRSRLLELGAVVEDGAEGPRIKRKP